MLEKVQAALGAIQAEGTFATTLVCGSEELEMEVKGVGPIRFPISAATARKLCGVASPAPFGLREKTLHDTSVRDTWQLGRNLVKIDTRRWKKALRGPLSVIQRRLSLPDEGLLEAVFDKMLIYGPGQFFAPHKDSERSDSMIGSLTVELPSAYSGGAILVEHGAQKKVFRRPKRGRTDLSLLAFYADCTHEVRPVKSGYRIALTYELHYHRAARSQALALPSAAVDRLLACVRDYFNTRVQETYSRSAPQKPDRLAYLLDHEYTQKSLSWGRLKNGDRLRAAALRQVAERLDCEIYLALADVHEIWECESDGWSGRYSSRRSYGRRRWEDDVNENENENEDEDEDLEAGGDAEDYQLLDQIEWDLELCHFLTPEGKEAADIRVAPASSEVCFTRASDEMEPFKSEHEGWMGNYGNTVERWYHRAAVVMWPRERNYVIRAKTSPEWAIGELLAQINAGALREAAESARSLLPFWSWAAPREPSANFFGKLLKVLGALSDSELASALLAPLGPHFLSPQTLRAFAALATRHGLPWARQVFSQWTERLRYEARSWLQILPALCTELVNAESGHEFTLWLIEREVSAFEVRHKAALNSPSAWPHAQLDASQPKRHREELLALFDAASVLQARSIRDRLLRLLLDPATALPLLSTGEFLRACRRNRTPAALRALGVEPLYCWVVDELERIVSAPERSASDWSIEPPSSCRCALCTELSAFLRDSNRIEYAWPLVQHQRQHIHTIMDAHHLPVKHETTRRGRPYTLVLTKQTALFQRAAALRKKQQELLGWLRQQRAAFLDDSGSASPSRAPL